MWLSTLLGASERSQVGLVLLLYSWDFLIGQPRWPFKSLPQFFFPEVALQTLFFNSDFGLFSENRLSGKLWRENIFDHTLYNSSTSLYRLLFGQPRWPFKSLSQFFSRWWWWWWRFRLCFLTPISDYFRKTGYRENFGANIFSRERKETWNTKLH